MAILGSGWVADMHHRAARRAGLEVVAVAAHDREHVATFATEHDIPRSTTDWQSLCADPGVDAVVVATPNSQHAEQTIHALRCGKHVLVEKPMATDVPDAMSMVDAANTADRVLVVGHMWRYRDEVVALRHRIARGDLGRVVRTHGFGIHAGWGPTGWFTDRGLSGGGALIDMGIHAIDTARFLLGDPLPLDVSASMGTAFGDYDVEDDGVMIIDWQGGARSTVEFGWWQPALPGLEADTVVLATSGAGRIWPTPEQMPVGYVHCSVEMYARQIADFAQSCSGGSPPIASAEVGLMALRIVADAYRSAGVA